MPQSGEPHAWSLTEAAAALATRTISAREYLEALLARVAKHNDALRLIVTLDEQAYAAAAEADERVARGTAFGPLHGVALSLKDCFATAGLRTTAGALDLATYVPHEDAAIVRSLKRAGAYVYAKSNMPEHAADVQTHNELFGTARNPWNPDYTTGGSSGGSAGAVAAGFSAAEVGTDVAGSIRIPAAYCGIVGHKPSFGVVPLFGQVPLYPSKHALPDIAVAGPLARTVDDAELMLDVICGPHPWDEEAWRLELPPPRSGRRIAVWATDSYCPVDAEVVDAIAAVGDRLAGRGFEVRADQPDLDFPACDEAFRRLLVWINGGAYSDDELREIAGRRRRPGAELGADFVAQRFVEWKAANELRHAARAVWRRFFERYDALLMPATVSCAGRHDQRAFAERTVTVNGEARPYWDQLTWAGLTGMAYLPSTVVPAGRDTRGLPIGVAICGSYLHDKTTLRVAREAMAVVPSIGRPDLS
jgi:amidase